MVQKLILIFTKIWDNENFTRIRGFGGGNAIPTVVRLMITLKYLATGDNYKSHMYLFHIFDRNISRIILVLCRSLTRILLEKSHFYSIDVFFSDETMCINFLFFTSFIETLYFFGKHNIILQQYSLSIPSLHLPHHDFKI